MTGGKHEAIAVEPIGVLGVILHGLVKQDVAHGSTPHGESRVARFGLLDGIDGQEADRVDRLLDEGLRVGRLDCLHGGSPDRSHAPIRTRRQSAAKKTKGRCRGSKGAVS